MAPKLHTMRAARPCTKMRRCFEWAGSDCFHPALSWLDECSLEIERKREKQEKRKRAVIAPFVHFFQLFLRLSFMCTDVARESLFKDDERAVRKHSEKKNQKGNTGRETRGSKRYLPRVWEERETRFSLQNCRLPGEMKANGGA